MAQTVHLTLKANGSDIEGESTLTSLDRDKTIECLSYSGAVDSAAEHGTGRPTGHRSYSPIFITKRIDKSSPLLNKALSENQVIEGTFRFYRPSPSGDGTEEQFFTVTIEKGRICSLSRMSPDVHSPETAGDPPTETVGFVFGKIVWTYEDGGVEHEDHVRENS